MTFKSGEIGSAYFLNSFMSKNMEDAVSYLHQSIEYFKKVNNRPSQGNMYLNLAHLYKDNGEFEQYEENLQKAIEILKDQDDWEDKHVLYRALKIFYKYKGNYKLALSYSDSLRKSQFKLDSIHNFTNVSLLERKYENENLQSEIGKTNELLVQKEITEKAERTKALVLMFLFGISLIFISVVIYLMIRVKIKNKKLSMKSRLLNEKNYELRKLADYNSLLMKETNHRVKNNLAMLAGIVRIKIKKSEDPELIRKLTEIEGRINSISAVHKNIYLSDNYSQLNAKNVVEEIIHNQKSIVDTELSENIHHNIDDFEVDISKILPLTLIINELLTNSIKYALKTPQDYIKITLKYNSKHSTIELYIEDSGQGFNFSDKKDEKKSIGLYLVKLLSRQLKADLNFKKGPDFFCTRLTFKIEE